MDLHRTAVTFRDRGHYAIIRFSSDGRDPSRSWRRAESSGASDLHHADGSESREPWGSCESRSPGSPSDGPRSSRSTPIVATRGPLQSAGFPSDDGGQSWKNSTIEVRSNRDRGEIEPWTGSLRGGIVAIQADGDRRTIWTTIVARSRPDRGLIVAKKHVIRKRN